MSSLEFLEVEKSYEDEPVVRGINLTINDGEFFVLLGPSGCGKSTLLKLVAGLEPVTRGEIYIDDELINYVQPGRRNLAMVFQSYALYPHMTVRDNVAFPLKMLRRDGAEIATEVGRVASLLGLQNLLDRSVGQLSGGQRQRVALARALVREPRIMLMDEPLSNLDALLRVQTRDELMKLHRQVPGTVVYVTHDQVEAMTMGDRIGVMSDGVLLQVGSPDEVYTRPASVFAATFIGSPQMNLVSGELERSGGDHVLVSDGLRLPLPSLPDAVAGRVRTVGVRPEDLALAPSDVASIGAEVVLDELMGADRQLVVRAHGRELRLRVPARVRVREGENVGLALAPGALHYFDEDGVRITEADDATGSSSRLAASQA